MFIYAHSRDDYSRGHMPKLCVIGFPTWQPSSKNERCNLEDTYFLQLVAPFHESNKNGHPFTTIEELILMQQKDALSWKKYANSTVTNGIKLKGNNATLLHGSLESGTGLEVATRAASRHWLPHNGNDKKSNAFAFIDFYIVHMANFFDENGIGGLAHAHKLVNLVDYVVQMQVLLAPMDAVPFPPSIY